ncbi:MAG: Dihydropteroate synthase [Desulfovibrio sp.]
MSLTMTNKPGVWKSRGGRGFGSAPFLVAGIVNITPDSFSDGGQFDTPESAMARCRHLLKDGVAILDIGAESTRPGSSPASAETELDRLMPIVSGCVAMRDAAKGQDFHVAVDTWRASTAAAALEAGVDIINDISGSTFDPVMVDVLASYKPGYVLMHTPGTPKTMQRHTDYDSVVDSVLHFFEGALTTLTEAGLPEENIVLDPGIGFGKTAEQNLELFLNVDKLHSLGRPLYIGASRKQLFGDLLGVPLDNRDGPTQVLTVLLAQRGVYVHRVHDASGALAALRLLDLLS